MSDDDIIDFYENRYDESARLVARTGNLEFVRTVDILERFLPKAPATILDLGGGAGIYAEWLAQLGHDVLLIDPIQRHVDAAVAIDAGAGTITATIGDARTVDLPDDSVDAVLMLGPLYHLVEPEDRVAAWAQAARVCRDDGFIAAAIISRFASLHDMLTRNQLTEDGVSEMVLTDLATGQHRNPGKVADRFATAYFHDPAEIADEALAGGVEVDHVIGVEGLAGYTATTADQLASDAGRAALLDMLRQVEQEPSIIGVSNHILAIAAR